MGQVAPVRAILGGNFKLRGINGPHQKEIYGGRKKDAVEKNLPLGNQYRVRVRKKGCLPPPWEICTKDTKWTLTSKQSGPDLEGPLGYR